MIITLYKSSLCPRCYLAKIALLASIKEHPDCQLEEIDILTSPAKAYHAGITMIPAIIIGDKKLSSIYLTRKNIDTFLAPFLL